MNSKNINITDYDKFKYNYKDYWLKQNREYEDSSDRIAVSRLLNKSDGKSIIDIGGSFGRLYPMYKDKYKVKIIFDYSFEALKDASNNLKNDGNTYFVCGDLYNLPFSSNSIDDVICVRVLHHILDLKTATGSIARIVKNNIFIEFANKSNFKNLIFSPSIYFSKGAYSQKTKGTGQGSEQYDDQIFLNHDPKEFIDIARDKKFVVKETLSVSNFRSQFLKRIFGLNILIYLEKHLQRTLGIIFFGPSIFLHLVKDKLNGMNIEYELNNTKDYETFRIEDILVCPQCQNSLETNLLCTKCNKSYRIINGIYVFRDI